MLILSSHEHYIIRDIIGGLRLYRIKLCLKMRKRIRRDYTQYSLIFLFKSRGEFCQEKFLTNSYTINIMCTL